MPQKPRYEVADSGEVQVFQAVQRCVRRVFLCGEDFLCVKTGFQGNPMIASPWWDSRSLDILASVFGIDCLSYTVLSNHLHLVVRSKPDMVAPFAPPKKLGTKEESRLAPLFSLIPTSFR
ncbi:hypothetical protein CA13_01630 [Planctomycetes bacterium CA13]|uniref:Transposase IS200-like domain-containing protein n=1 Tax=Novipirellula herctigrandis TaxID=2527986 RepID=A0A5C5YVH9_9BACT|nr:hypothetical protein CA13_01630 [Planctomycetes bacterium CA13]